MKSDSKKDENQEIHLLALYPAVDVIELAND